MSCLSLSHSRVPVRCEVGTRPRIRTIDTALHPLRRTPPSSSSSSLSKSAFRNRRSQHRAKLCRTTASVEDFVWKGADKDSGALGPIWEEPGVYQEAPEGSGIEWFLLDAKPTTSASEKPPTILIHGIPAYSFMWRNVVPALVAAGRRAVAVDLPGFGNSTCPPTGGGFGYSIEDYVQGLDALIATLEGVEGPVEVVGQGLLGGTVAALWAARNPAGCSRLVLMNTPLDAGSAAFIPKSLQGLLNPLMGLIMSQNPLKTTGQPIEGAGPYALDVNDQAAYMAPALANGNAGFALVEVLKELKKNGPKAVQEAVATLSGEGGPEVTVVWGEEDRWLGPSPPGRPPASFTVSTIAGAGHFTAEDWAEKVGDELVG